VDFVRRWSEKTEIGAGRFIGWLDITASKFYDWRERYGKVNEHNGWVPRDFWLEDWEKQAPRWPPKTGHRWPSENRPTR
jgi:putative transposase